MNDDEAYLLGALLDAHVDYKRNEIQLYQKRRDWLEFVNNKLYLVFGVRGKLFKRDVFLLRKRSKAMVAKLKCLLKQKEGAGIYFVGGLFDSEGSAYFSTKSRIPVIDITQAGEGLQNLRIAQRILQAYGIRSNLNGPYFHKHGRLEQYHLRIYGKEKSKKFLKSVPIYYSEKFGKFSAFMERVDSKL